MLKQVIDLFEVMDDKYVTAEKIKELFQRELAAYPGGDPVELDFTWKRVEGKEGATEFVTVRIPGRNGRSAGGSVSTLGVLGTLGGIGARPAVTGFVSDGDGALAALAVGLKLLRMQQRGDWLDGDVIITTHICPDASTVPHDPVPFMGSPASDEQINENTVLPEMDAILSIDTSKGNEVINKNGFAISCTVKEGYILKASQPLLEIMKRTTGKPPQMLPLSQQDITPYGNGLTHVNSILQPAVATGAPVVGIAITTELPAPGSGSGASHLTDIENAARFAVEVAKEMGRNAELFFDAQEYQLIKGLYGELTGFQTKGAQEKIPVGIITTGQAHRSDIKDDVESILGPQAGFNAVGVLDGFSLEEIQRWLWPKEAEPYIVTLIDGDVAVKVEQHKMHELIQKKIGNLEEQGIRLSLLMCTGSFPGLKKNSFVVEPARVIASALEALEVEKLGILIPEAEQAPETLAQYGRYSPVVKAALPYGPLEAVAAQGAAFANEDVDVILMDCMGYTKAMGDIVRKASGKPVLVARVLAAHMVKSLL